MKLSLAWIFDHIKADWKSQDVQLIFKKFNAITAEIEQIHSIDFDLTNFFMATLVEQSNDSIVLEIPELGNKVSLPLRAQAQDLLALKPGLCFMVKRIGADFSWATATDFDLEKGGPLPAFDVAQADLSGNWRAQFESSDVMIEVDNKSITHRPDMWGHRGFAREIAAFLDLPLKPESEFLKPISISTFQETSQSTATTPFVVHNDAPELCAKFTGLYFSSIEHKPSNLLFASRLLKVGLKPHGALVDATNYLMQDWSQPVHAYDAQKIDGKKIIIRTAKNGEKLELLDGTTITLTDQDLVIADAQKPMCLAGVKGGLHSGVGPTTTQLFFESANFQATSVRKTAQRHKLRTDSSARYEKTLDPEQALQGAARFAKLLEKCDIKAVYADEIIALGKQKPDEVIEVEHAFLQARSGVALTEQDIVSALTCRDFKVQVQANAQGEKIYIVTVPSFRASKDIKIREDILEEVIRAYGFERIPHVLPHFAQRPFSLTSLMRMRAIKRFLAFSARMTEQQNYAFHDESFLNQLHLKPGRSADIINPVSENHYRMIDSLVPGLLKNVKENYVGRDRLAFFECGKYWNRFEQTIIERKSVAGIIFDKRANVDFYECKQYLLDLLGVVGIQSQAVLCKKASSAAVWYNKQQTCELFYNDMLIGTAGKADAILLSKLDIIQGADAFVFELDLDFLLDTVLPVKRMEKISKYQETSFDISILVPLNVAVATLEREFSGINPLVYKVELADFFEKEEWKEQRSLTFRFWISHHERTLEKEDIDAIWQAAIACAQKHGATLRA